jgi:hypothetical protein
LLKAEALVQVTRAQAVVLLAVQAAQVVVEIQTQAALLLGAPAINQDNLEILEHLDLVMQVATVYQAQDFQTG